jgi:hypothetical protein
VLVLPAFTEWAGGARLSRLRGSLPPAEWRQVVVTDGAVLELPAGTAPPR